MYKIYVNHPDDGMIKSIETPWKPELLEALEALLAEWEAKERSDGREWGQREVVMARAVIAKAKGES